MLTQVINHRFQRNAIAATDPDTVNLSGADQLVCGVMTDYQYFSHLFHAKDRWILVLQGR